MAQQQRVGKVATAIYVDDDGYTNVIFHDTAVVSFNDEEIILDSGGWRTPTTKTRMNQASHQFDLGYSVFQKEYDWYVSYGGTVLPFEDGMVLAR